MQLCVGVAARPTISSHGALTHSIIPMGNCRSCSVVEPSSPPPLPAPRPALAPETAKCTHPTSMPSGSPNVSYPSSSSSQGSRRKPAHATTPCGDDAMTSTPSPKPGVVRHARAQSQGTASRHSDRQHTSGGAGPMQRTRSVSMGVTSLQGARSHPSDRRTWAASISSQDNGTQSMSATIQILTGRQEGRPRLPFSLPSLLSNNVKYAVRRCSTGHY